MTATEVDGIAVVSDEPTVAPGFRNRTTGEPVLWKRTRTLTLANGVVIYGCGEADCDYTNTKALSIRPHLNKHRDGPRRTPRIAVRTVATSALSTLSLVEIEQRLKKFAQIEAELTMWRQRALAAERSIRTMRSALGVPTIPAPRMEGSR